MNNEIKKSLYKENPLAHLLGITKDTVDYRAELSERYVFFTIPINDIGDATFYSKMPAKHLIRYISVVTNKEASK